jgi:hypothetical protein
MNTKEEAAKIRTAQVLYALWRRMGVKQLGLPHGAL